MCSPRENLAEAEDKTRRRNKRGGRDGGRRGEGRRAKRIIVDRSRPRSEGNGPGVSRRTGLMFIHMSRTWCGALGGGVGRGVDGGGGGGRPAAEPAGAETY